MEFKVKVVKVGNSLRVTIPKELTSAMNLHVGDTVALIPEENHLILKKKESS